LHTEILKDHHAKLQTYGTVLSSSRQQRNLMQYDKTIKKWEKEAEDLSKKCHRKSKTESLMERSDQYAIKIQELDHLSKNSHP
jgi:uncharacterized protein YaaR (DUF327 family)